MVRYKFPFSYPKVIQNHSDGHFFPIFPHHSEQIAKSLRNRRLQLLRVLVERPNVLILDEPTNDLDAAAWNAWSHGWGNRWFF